MANTYNFVTDEELNRTLTQIHLISRSSAVLFTRTMSPFSPHIKVPTLHLEIAFEARYQNQYQDILIHFTLTLSVWVSDFRKTLIIKNIFDINLNMQIKIRVLRSYKLLPLTCSTWPLYRLYYYLTMMMKWPMTNVSGAGPEQVGRMHGTQLSFNLFWVGIRSFGGE